MNNLSSEQIDAILYARGAKLRARPRPEHEVLRAQLLEQGLRYCPCCEAVHPIIEFTKNKARKDGYKVYCKTCQKLKREVSKAYNAQKSKEWREANPERNKELKQNWTDKNRLQENARLRVVAANRRNLMKVSIVEEVDYNEILVRDNYMCHICSKHVEVADVHFDHVIPLSKGGPHTMDNVKVSHSLWNQRKGNKVTATIKAG